MKKVMIVDDTMFMRTSLRMILERNGYEVVGEAENGKIAVTKYSELKPDIVTMDITMPEMDGITAVKEIIALDKNAKICMISSLGQEKIVVEAINAGAKNFVIKPFKEEFVIKTLSSI